MAQVSFEGKTNSEGTGHYIQVYISGLDTSFDGNRRLQWETVNQGTIISGTEFIYQHNISNSGTYSFTISVSPPQIKYKLEYAEGSSLNWQVVNQGTVGIIYPPKKWQEWDNLNSNNIIQSEKEGISAASWNRFIDEIIDLRKHLEINSYEIELNKIKVKPGDLITAKIYNAARKYIGRTEDSETEDVIAGETLITANHFKKLAADLNKYI